MRYRQRWCVCRPTLHLLGAPHPPTHPPASHPRSMLEQLSIPLMAADRGDGQPLVFGGGPVLTANPEPYADFFDVVLLGERVGGCCRVRLPACCVLLARCREPAGRPCTGAAASHAAPGGQRARARRPCRPCRRWRGPAGRLHRGTARGQAAAGATRGRPRAAPRPAAGAGAGAGRVCAAALHSDLRVARRPHGGHRARRTGRAASGAEADVPRRHAGQQHGCGTVRRTWPRPQPWLRRAATGRACGMPGAQPLLPPALSSPLLSCSRVQAHGMGKHLHGRGGPVLPRDVQVWHGGRTGGGGGGEGAAARCRAPPGCAPTLCLPRPPACAPAPAPRLPWARFCMASYLTLPFRPAALEGSLIPSLEARRRPAAPCLRLTLQWLARRACTPTPACALLPTPPAARPGCDGPNRAAGRVGDAAPRV